ncbi:hypothetical protein [Vibrio alfacsensis]|uniref:hypothetical protein n=1 Tax=Vibrio alfacsensis TaxID=1074311 RepID=UPI00406775F1
MAKNCLLLRPLLLAGSCIYVYYANASQVDLTATVSSELTFSDNINVSRQNEQSGMVSTWSAGTSIEKEGNGGNLSFQYDVYQTLHSVDSDRNELFNELSFAANKSIYRENIEFNTQAIITNIARSIENDAAADIISGDTIETRTIDAQLSYQSNPRGWFDLYGVLDGGVESNEDDIGDYYSFGSDLVFQNGTSVKQFFWLTEYSYNRNTSSNTDNEYYNYTAEQEIGLQPIKHFSPLIRVFYEGYTRRDESKTIESGSWGPALRYYWHERSFLELGYDFSFHDKDFWRGSIKLQPTSRTSAEFEYTRRFYGDSYDLSFSHRSKKLTNTVTYTEELRGFDRQFFIAGENIEEYQLVREFILNTTLNLKRTSLTTGLRLSKRNTLSDTDEVGDSNIYGGEMSAEHSLSRRTSLSGRFTYDKYVFEPKLEDRKHDYYRRYEISLNNQFSRSLSLDFSIEHANNSSYKENRANINLEVNY